MAKAQALMAGSRKAKQGIVPVMNRENGFGIVGSHGLGWLKDRSSLLSKSQQIHYLSWY
jgi:hypothetical protein